MHVVASDVEIEIRHFYHLAFRRSQQRDESTHVPYLDVFSIYNRAFLSDWLGERGELWVDIHLPRGGSSERRASLAPSTGQMHVCHITLLEV